MTDSNFPLSISNLSEAHVEAAMGICRQAGWNQLEEDWLRLIRYDPEGCFAAMCGDRLAGTVTNIRYGQQVAWIGMMLVDPDFRRRGIADALMRTSLDYLRAQRVSCIKLDATPVGELVYQRLGFQVEWRFQRWCRAGAGHGLDGASAHSTPLSDAIWELDREAFGVDRSPFLKRVCSAAHVHATGDGYGMLRPGSLATYLGPIAARGPVAARMIVERLCETVAGTIFWDIPGPNESAVEIARSLGFEPVRDLARMWLGQECVAGNAQLLYALTDPSVG